MSKKELRDTIQSDLHRYWGDRSRKSFVTALLKVPGFRYTFLLRHCAYFRENGARLRLLLCRVLLNRYRFRYGFEIPYMCRIGKGLYLGHFGGVVINVNTWIGRNVNIAQGVTIGQVNRGSRKGAPTIGDRVWIGANAIVVGSVSIGDGALIAPGAYVNFDVPENAVVVGNPGKVVSYGGTEGYVCNTVDEVGSTEAPRERVSL